MTRISIVTVCYNCKDSIGRTIRSVLAQDYPHLEHVIIDGGSTDGTTDAICRLAGEKTRWLSETDRGLYDAMNKGWKMATGDVVGFLNADDTLAEARSISRIARTFQHAPTDAVYGDIELIANDGRVVRKWSSGRFHRMKYHLGWMTPHPVTYARRALFEKYGGFRQDLPISADYELMLRFFYRHRASVAYLPQTLVKMRAGGASNGSIAAVAKANWQVYQSWRMNGLVTSPSVMLTKPLSKLLQLRI